MNGLAPQTATLGASADAATTADAAKPEATKGFAQCLAREGAIVERDLGATPPPTVPVTTLPVTTTALPTTDTLGAATAIPPTPTPTKTLATTTDASLWRALTSTPTDAPALKTEGDAASPDAASDAPREDEEDDAAPKLVLAAMVPLPQPIAAPTSAVPWRLPTDFETPASSSTSAPSRAITATPTKPTADDALAPVTIELSGDASKTAPLDATTDDTSTNAAPPPLAASALVPPSGATKDAKALAPAVLAGASAANAPAANATKATARGATPRPEARPRPGPITSGSPRAAAPPDARITTTDASASPAPNTPPASKPTSTSTSTDGLQRSPQASTPHPADPKPKTRALRAEPEGSVTAKATSSDETKPTDDAPVTTAEHLAKREPVTTLHAAPATSTATGVSASRSHRAVDVDGPTDRQATADATVNRVALRGRVEGTLTTEALGTVRVAAREAGGAVEISVQTTQTNTSEQLRVEQPALLRHVEDANVRVADLTIQGDSTASTHGGSTRSGTSGGGHEPRGQGDQARDERDEDRLAELSRRRVRFVL